MSRLHRTFRVHSRFVLVAFIVLIPILTLAPHGPGASAQEKVELRIWDQFTDPTVSDAAQGIYDDFMAANPDIEIVRESFDTDQMRETVNTAIASVTGPDVIFYDAGPGYAGVLANAGLLTPLDQYADQYGWRDRFAPSSIAATSLGGQLYGLPLNIDLIGMYYNQTLLDQEGLTAPETFDQLLAFCGQAKEKGYIPFAFGDLDGWPAFHQFSMTANQMLGPEGVNQLIQGQGSWNTPEIVTAIKAYFVDMRDAGCFSDDVNAITYDDGNALFYSGQSLLHSTGSWLSAPIAANMPDQDVRFVPFPELPGGKGRTWVSGVSSAFYITSGADNLDAAAKFLDYAFSPEIVARWTQDAQYVVPIQFDASGVQTTDLFRQILDTLQTAATQGTVFGSNVDVLAPPQFNEAMSNGFQAILAGDKTPDELAAELDAAWKEGMAGQQGQATPAP